MAVQTRITAAEFLTLPETMLPTELIHGEVIMSPSPEISHQDIALRLAIYLTHKAPNGKVHIAPLDVYLDDLNVVQPDVLWVAEGSTCVAVDGKYLRGGPDFVGEVASPGTVRRDKKEKFRLYETYGVREYWMIDPAERLIEVWQRVEGQFRRLDVFGPGEQINSGLFGAVEVKSILGE